MKSKRVIMILSLAAFFLISLFPLWGNLFPQPEVGSLEENRNMTEWSFSGSLKDRIGTLENYLNDHLAFRQSVITAVLRANLALGESPHEEVAAGTDGWLFYITGSEDLRSGVPIEEDSIRELYDVQQQARNTFAASGADYRPFLAPDKSSVYPQYLPLSCRFGSGPSSVDQMLDAPEGYTVRLTDLRPAMMEASAELQQYYKTDTHWNANGAWTAYQVLMDALLPDHPAIRRLSESDLYRFQASYSGDLASMIGQKDIMTESFESVAISAPTARPDPDRSGRFEVTVNDAIPEAPRLLFIHDSFGPALLPYLQESFSEVWTMTNDSVSFDTLGDLSLFDVVLYEVVERNRSWLWNGFSSGSGGWADDNW